MKFMGAKDALCKTADTNMGLEDTCAYYDDTALTTGFKKTTAFQPRVIKQKGGHLIHQTQIGERSQDLWCAQLHGRRGARLDEGELQLLRGANRG